MEDATVGVEAFSRIASAVPIIANVIVSNNIFNVLTSATDCRLHFSVYEKYLIGMERYNFLSVAFLMYCLTSSVAHMGCISSIHPIFLPASFSIL